MILPYYFLAGFFFAMLTWWLSETHIKEEGRPFDEMDCFLIVVTFFLWPIVLLITIIYWRRIQGEQGPDEDDYED